MKASVVALLVLLTLEMSPQEFAELQRLSDEARRARFALPDSCTPGVSAIRPAGGRSQRLIVLIDCRAAEPAERDLLPI